MLIIPPIVDMTPLDKALADSFMKKGYNVFILKYPEKINDFTRPLKDLNKAIVSIMTSSRILLDYAQTQEEIDSRRIACYGMSLGALIGSVLTSIEKRVDAGILIVGGGHLPEILSESEQFVAAGFREKRMKIEGIETVKEFKKILEKSFLFDPLFFASPKNKNDVYMVMAGEDTSIPTKNQFMLWKSYGEPTRFYIKEKDHFPTILQNLSQHGRIFDFLEGRLSKEL